MHGINQPLGFISPDLLLLFSLQEEISDFHSLASDTGSAISEPHEFLEQEPVGLEAGIEIRNLRKVFNTEKGLQIIFMQHIYFVKRLNQACLAGLVSQMKYSHMIKRRCPNKNMRDFFAVSSYKAPFESLKIWFLNCGI